MFGSLMKPDMSYIDSKPFIYEDDETYIAVNYDWSNLGGEDRLCIIRLQ